MNVLETVDDRTCREVCIAGSDISTSIGSPITGRQLFVLDHNSSTERALLHTDSTYRSTSGHGAQKAGSGLI